MCVHACASVYVHVYAAFVLAVLCSPCVVVDQELEGYKWVVM